jgi:hypothetical protein
MQTNTLVAINAARPDYIAIHRSEPYILWLPGLTKGTKK